MGGERNRPKAAGEERIRVLCAAQRWSTFCCTFRHIIRAIWKEVQNPTGMCFGRRSSRKPDVLGSAAAPADVGTQHSSTAAARRHGRDQQAPAQELCSLGTAQPNLPCPKPAVPGSLGRAGTPARHRDIEEHERGAPRSSGHCPAAHPFTPSPPPMTRVPEGNALPALWAATFPNSCCVYLPEPLNPGVSRFLLSVKLGLYDHAVYHWEKTNSLTTLKS